MGSTEAILSAQMANKCFSVNKFMVSPVPQMPKQSDGSYASGSRRQPEKKEMNDSAAKIAGKQQQQQQQQLWSLKARFAVELDGLNCFETLVPV